MFKKLSWLVILAVIMNLFVGTIAVFSADNNPTNSGPSGDVLKFTATRDVAKMGNHWFWVISKDATTFQKGDYLEYDVYLDDNSPGLGGMELYFADDSSIRDLFDYEDQNAFRGHPGTDISPVAYKQWYHRKLPIPADVIGKTNDRWCFGVESPSSKPVTVYYDNIVLTNGGKVVKELYIDGEPTANETKGGVGYECKVEVVKLSDIVSATPAPTPAPTTKPVAPTVLTLKIGSTELTVNQDGNASKVALDTAPVISKDGRTFLPIRAVVEALGGELSWEAKTQKIGITQGKNSIEMWIGKSVAKVYGVDKAIDSTNSAVTPYISSTNRTMVPLRFVSENMGANVEFEAKTQLITITYQP